MKYPLSFSQQLKNVKTILNSLTIQKQIWLMGGNLPTPKKMKE